MSASSILKVIPLADTDDQTNALGEMFSCLSGDLEEKTLHDLKEAVVLREETSPTYLEHGLAVPHGRIHSLEQVVIAVGLNQRGIDWPVQEDRARVIVMVGVPAPMVTGYLKILQKIIKWHKSSRLIEADGSIDPARIPILEQEFRAVLA